MPFSFIREKKLAGGARPIGDDLSFLWEEGIQAILTLTEIPLSGTEKFSTKHIPIRDFYPPTKEQADEAVLFINEMCAEEKPVFVHCTAGIGRTGTILAAYLIAAEKLTADEAIDEIRRLRPGSIETRDQIAFLMEYEKNQK